MFQPAIQFLKNEYPQLRQLIIEGEVEALSARFAVLEAEGQSWRTHQEAVFAITNERISTCFLSVAASLGNFLIFRHLVETQNILVDNESLFIALQHAVINGKADFVSMIFATSRFQILTPQELINLLALAKAFDQRSCVEKINDALSNVPKYQYLPLLAPLIKSLIQLKEWIPEHFHRLKMASNELIELIGDNQAHQVAYQAAINLQLDISSCLDFVRATSQIPLELLIRAQLQLAIVKSELSDIMNHALDDARCKTDSISLQLNLKEQIQARLKSHKSLVSRPIQSIQNLYDLGVDNGTDITISALIYALDGSLSENHITVPAKATFKQVKSTIAQMAMCSPTSLVVTLEGHEVDESDKVEKDDLLIVSFSPYTTSMHNDDVARSDIGSSSGFTSYYDDITQRMRSLSFREDDPAAPSTSSPYTSSSYGNRRM